MGQPGAQSAAVYVAIYAQSHNGCGYSESMAIVPERPSARSASKKWHMPMPQSRGANGLLPSLKK